MTSPKSPHPKRIRRVLATTLAGVTLGVGGTYAVAAAQAEPAPVACRPTAADLMRATGRGPHARSPAARSVRTVTAPRRAYADLRLAAEWARRMSALRPDDCTRANR